MKIGIVGTVWLNTPPNNYGGTEEIVYNLVNKLVDKGHEVTFFGPATANVKAKLIPTVEMPLREKKIKWTDIGNTLFHLTEAFDHSSNFDIMHVHLNKTQDFVSLPFSVYKNIPTLFTLHFPFPNKREKPEKFSLLVKYRHLPFNSISHSQQETHLNYVATVHNGIDTSQFTFIENPSEYFIWLGKIAPFKGTKEAILAAKSAGVKIVLLGVIEEGVPENLSYYHEEVEPRIDNKQVVLYENVGMPEKAILLGHAKALLNPISWEEPFGLVMVESQATGTPVIAFNRGAAPEVIQNGKTGYVVNTFDELVRRILDVDKLDRRYCRKFVEENFSVEQMVEGYESAYQNVIKNWTEYYIKQITHTQQ